MNLATIVRVLLTALLTPIVVGGGSILLGKSVEMEELVLAYFVGLSLVSLTEIAVAK